MARGHGRILSSIWEDEDFLALTEQQQRLYLFLISQPNLNHAGLLPLTLRRWTRKAMGLTAAELESHLAALAAARFIVMDEDTEELLIRSFVRNDGVWKQPKVMGAMVSGAMEIESKALRHALVLEMDRIPLDELSDEPTKVRSGEGPSIRTQVYEHMTTLRKAFGDSGPGPSGGGYRPPSEPPSGTPSDSPAEGRREGSTRAGAGAHDAQVHAGASRAHSPAPSPSPVPSPVEEGGYRPEPKAEGAPRLALPGPSGPAPIDDDGFELTDAMRRWAVATFGNALDVDYETEQFLSHFRADGGRRRNWPEEWKKWLRRSAKYASERAHRPTPGGSVVPFRDRQQQASDDMFDRAMARAQARMQQETS
ncbi:hypothetical protein [Streptomyces coffeae]|uniref:Helix-turn-helix domain-containing protein n=1 Tax=Streptomyces coffeae TaxID=621382 RepID=A0ABS1NJG7_9ACTN|nr:hypothetical protein [Streptomyces coffeae]MBL1100110.1 hypothetical protein [Streptomyces coffeae]